MLVASAPHPGLLTTFLSPSVYDIPHVLTLHEKEDNRAARFKSSLEGGTPKRSALRRKICLCGCDDIHLLPTVMSCSDPLRRNTLLFRSARDAEKQGYNACLRCHPQCSLTPTEAKIVAALRYADIHSDQAITLRTLSRASGLSAHHLRETFKTFVGLSPKLYCDVRRIATFKALVEAGESISSACYEAGLAL